MLKISDQLSLPLDVAGEAIGILATRGAGKSFTSAVIAEELWKAKVQFCVLDPCGVFWGLRGGDGLPVIVLGGIHGDAPLESTAGRLIADVLADTGQSLVLDLSDFTKGEQTRFVSDLADGLFNRKARERSTLHLILDEADEFAPQKPLGKDEPIMLGRINRLVAKGRSRGIGVTLITQRSAAINKGVLDLVDTLIAMRVLSPRDRKAIQGWVDYKQLDDDEGVVASLPSLQTGTAWVWSPVRDILAKVQVRHIATFDSYATPKPGKTIRQPKALAPVDIEKLGEQIKATVEKAKANDPKELKRRIAALEKKLSERPKEQVAVEKIIEVPVLKNGQLDRTEKIADRLQVLTDKFTAETQELRRLISAATTRPAVATKTIAPQRPATIAPTKTPRPQPTEAGDVQLGKCERAILAVLAQHPEGCTSGKLTLLAGYRYSGGFKNSLSALRQAGYIVGANTSIMAITGDGLAALGDYEPLPSGRALAEYWLNHPSFGACEKNILRALLDNPDGMTAEQLCAATGYQYSGGFKNSLSSLRTAGVIVGKNAETMRANEDLL